MAARLWQRSGGVLASGSAAVAEQRQRRPAWRQTRQLGGSAILSAAAARWERGSMAAKRNELRKQTKEKITYVLYTILYMQKDR